MTPEEARTLAEEIAESLLLTASGQRGDWLVVRRDGITAGTLSKHEIAERVEKLLLNAYRKRLQETP